MSNAINRVTSVITDQLPKLEKMCDEVSAQANASVIRAINSVHQISQQFKAMDDAVSQLEQLAGLSNGGPPLGVKFDDNFPAEVNPNGPLETKIGPKLVE